MHVGFSNQKRESADGNIFHIFKIIILKGFSELWFRDPIAIGIGSDPDPALLYGSSRSGFAPLGFYGLG
jgi:hypothetical protein